MIKTKLYSVITGIEYQDGEAECHREFKVLGQTAQQAIEKVDKSIENEDEYIVEVNKIATVDVD